MEIQHKSTYHHGKIVAIVFDNDEEYKQMLEVINADIAILEEQYDKEAAKYLQVISEKIVHRYTQNETYNDGKPSTVLFDSEIMNIHYDYFFNFIPLLQFFDTICRKNKDIAEADENIIRLLKEHNAINEETIKRQQATIKTLEEVISRMEKTIQTYLDGADDSCRHGSAKEEDVTDGNDDGIHR